MLPILGFALFLLNAKFGWQILDPTHTNWMLIPCSDGLVGYNGWEHFKDQPWTFPLGLLKGYEYPVVTTIGLTDTTPIMAVLFKLLKPLFGTTEYHFFGIWIALSFLLQAFFGFKLLKALDVRSPILLILGSCFFLLAPPFLHRFVHPSLSMHWAILASFWIYFNTQLSLKQRIRWQLIFTAIMAWTHPYAAAMVTGLTLTIVFKIWLVEKKINARFALFTMLGTLLLVAILWAIMGYFSTKAALQNDGFGIYSANLNTLFNSDNRTNLLPALPHAPSLKQSEGFGYLGAGSLLLLLASFFFVKRPLFNKAILPLTILVILATFYAFSDTWTFNENIFLKVSYPSFLTQQFRSSGRFIWLLHYTILVGGLVVFIRAKLPLWIKTVGLVGLLSLQILDTKPLFSRAVEHHGQNLKFDQALWAPAVQAAERLITYPAFGWDIVDKCDQGKITHIAALYDKPVTCGRTVYSNNKQKSQFKRYLEAQIDSFQLASESQSLIITRERDFPKFVPLLKADVLKGFIWENYYVFIPTALYESNSILQTTYPQPLEEAYFDFQPESITAFIENRTAYTLLLSVKDDAQHALEESFYKMMEAKGSQVRSLAFRGSYAAIIQDSIVVERIDELEPVQIDHQNISLKSAGANADNVSQIKIDSIEYGPNKRGFNIVVLDQDSIVEIVNYDTFNSIYKKSSY